MTFYAWMDEQAGQLRFSIETAMPNTFCFSCKTRLVSMQEELRRGLKSPYRHGIPFDGFVTASFDAPKTWEVLPELPPLAVWAIRLAEKPVLPAKQGT